MPFVRRGSVEVEKKKNGNVDFIPPGASRQKSVRISFFWHGVVEKHVFLWWESVIMCMVLVVIVKSGAGFGTCEAYAGQLR